MGRRRKPSDGESGGGGHDGGGALRWLLTYADMITLLMAFFIMLYSMSILNLNKFRQVAISIRSGFGGLVEGQGKSILGTSGQFSVKPSPILGESVGVPWKVVKKIQRFVQEEDLGKSVRLRADERGLIISLATDEIMFAKGSAELSPKAKEIIGAVVDALKDVPNSVRVEGHACNLPVSSAKYPSNWELSTARATNVVRYLIEVLGFPADRLSAAGYADTKPIAPNDCEANRALNRRVDIVVLNSEWEQPREGSSEHRKREVRQIANSNNNLSGASVNSRGRGVHVHQNSQEAERKGT